MPAKKNTGSKLADMMYGNPEGAAFGVYPQAKRGQRIPSAKEQLDKIMADERGMELPQFGGVDLSVPTASNRAMGQRMVARDVDLKRQADQDMSPLEKMAGGMQAGRLMGSGMLQAVKSIPTAVTKGGKAAEDYISENIYKPNQPKAYEYAGDIGDFLSSLETDYKLPPILPEAVALQFLAGPAKQQAKRGALSAGMGLERAMEPVVNRALEGGGLPREMVMAMGANTQSNVMKPKGGNWLGGSVEGALQKLKRNTAAGNDPVEMLARMRERYTPEEIAKLPEGVMKQHVLNSFAELERDVALNNWVDRNLGNYVKKEMATPEDPVRRLAEEGITHLPDNEIDYVNQWIPERLAVNRMNAGFPSEGMGKSNTARGWEALTDNFISSAPAREYTKPLTESEARRGLTSVVDANPWLNKLDPETQVTYLDSPNALREDLGLDHIMDVLREDVNSGRIRPEQLNKVSMEQAVRRTYEYDQEMAKRMRETALKQQEGFPLHKEYPEGYRWIELTAGEKAKAKVVPLEGGGWTVEDATGHQMSGGFKSKEGAERALAQFSKSDPRYKEAFPEAKVKALEDALKYEGDTMGHCVGGYCPDVVEGRSRIFSLRDAKGEPHVTVETQPFGRGSLSGEDLENIEPGLFQKFLDQRYTEGGNDNMHQWLKTTRPEIANQERIIQIKGKSNAAPKDTYLPFVQDFVRSGQWSDVGDIQNTGLRNVSNWVNPDTAKEYEKFNLSVPKYATDEELDALHRQYEALSKPEGMAHGGRVHFSDNPDVMQLELQAGGLVKKALKAAVKTPQKAVPLVEAPGIVIPSGISSVKEAARQSKGEYGARRIERAADEVKNLEKFYNEKALREAFLGDNAKAVVTMDPADFERYAQILKGRTKADIGPKMAELAKQGDIDKYTVPMDEYIQHLMRVQGGFDQAPYLNLYKDEVGIPSMPEVRGHEGRHRSRALSEAGESKGLVTISPRGDLREGLPRGSQEEYIEALREELERSGRLVLPEADGSYRRPAIELPEPYAAGGAIRMGGGGALGKLSAKGAKAPMKASEALGRIEGRPLVITQADRTKVGGGFLGGPGFSGLQLEDPAYRAAEAAWAVKNPGTAKMILGGGREAGGDPVYAAMLGTPTQHQSNQMVFDKLYGDFKKAAKRGELEPELRDRINLRLANTVDKDGNPIFPPDVDILDKNFKNLASTFDRRSVTANLIGGMGVGGKKGQIIDYDKVIRQTTDPALVDAPTGALGNRLFTLSGGIIDRPDLHPAFPTILQGEDLGVNFDPVARDLIMKDYIERTMREKGRAPGIFDYTRGYPPSQLITEDILTELQKMGKKAGGAVRKAAGGEITADDLILEERKL